MGSLPMLAPNLPTTTLPSAERDAWAASNGEEPLLHWLVSWLTLQLPPKHCPQRPVVQYRLGTVHGRR